jgi:type VI secretion system secreted protein Hcp
MHVYLKYGKIKGNVKEPAHKSWIELTSVQWGVGRGMNAPAGQSSFREASVPDVTEIVVGKMMDEASPLLFQESLIGHGVTAVIDLVRDDGSVYLRLTMSETLISGYNTSSGGDKPTETLLLNFKKVDVKMDPGTPPPTF